MTLQAASLPLTLTMGDPAGCGPQITGAAWNALHTNKDACFFAVGSPAVFAPFCKVEEITDPVAAQSIFSTALPVLKIGADMPEVTPGTPEPAAAPAILSSIKTATDLTCNGKASALVTNPINKALLYGAGFEHPGHTEYLAALTASPGTAPPKPVMMLVGGGLRVALATIHMPLVEAAKSLTQAGLIEIARIAHTALERDFGLKTPRLAFTGLNPHAGENGTIGREEVDIINPAAETLRADGINISDARSADTVFAEALAGTFDAVIAMTHDQGLIPVKTLDFWGGVNTTLGLPIIRTSPDHGTAYEAAGAGTCRADSLIAAIRLASANAGHRANG